MSGFPTAESMRYVVQDTLERECNEELSHLRSLIEKAAANGKTHIIIPKMPSRMTQETLVSKGYKVTVEEYVFDSLDSCGSEVEAPSEITLSWKNDSE